MIEVHFVLSTRNFIAVIGNLILLLLAVDQQILYELPLLSERMDLLLVVI